MCVCPSSRFVQDIPQTELRGPPSLFQVEPALLLLRLPPPAYALPLLSSPRPPQSRPDYSRGEGALQGGAPQSSVTDWLITLSFLSHVLSLPPPRPAPPPALKKVLKLLSARLSGGGGGATAILFPPPPSDSIRPPLLPSSSSKSGRAPARLFVYVPTAGGASCIAWLTAAVQEEGEGEMRGVGCCGRDRGGILTLGFSDPPPCLPRQKSSSSAAKYAPWIGRGKG